MNTAARTSVLLSFLAAGLAPAALSAGLSCSPVNTLLDGGFEQASGTPPVCPDWTETSTQFGSPICSVESCVIGVDAGPRNGLFWARFGGTVDPAGESATLSQPIVLPVGTASVLSFFLRISTVGAPFTDVLEVRLDGDLLEAFPEPATSESAYAYHSYPLDAYADGGTHAVTFEFVGPGGGGFAEFDVDDVAVVVQQVATLAGGSFEDATGTPLDSPSWLEASTGFGSPLCTIAACGNGSGTVGPLTGDVWAWFGGVGGSTPETSSVTQNILLPFAAYVDLEFQLGIGEVNAPFTDELFVRMDADTIGGYLEPFDPETTYTARSIIIDGYADGLPHALKFEYIKGVDGNGANFSLDDVALAQVSCQAILLDGFETHDTTNWSLALP